MASRQLHEHPSSIAERFVDGFMHPGLEYDAERLARGYQDLEEQLEAAQRRIAELEQSWQDSASMATYTSSVSDLAKR